MARRDIIGDLVNIVHPVPDRPGGDASEHDLQGWSHWAEEIARQRERFHHDRELAWDDGDLDPLLGEIAEARQSMVAAQKRLRLLVAYGREFVQPRPYRLDDLARAAGMSISGVRTAYDDEEIVEVARLIGAKLRRRDTTPDGDDQPGMDPS